MGTETADEGGLWASLIAVLTDPCFIILISIFFCLWTVVKIVFWTLRFVARKCLGCSTDSQTICLAANEPNTLCACRLPLQQSEQFETASPCSPFNGCECNPKIEPPEPEAVHEPGVVSRMMDWAYVQFSQSPDKDKQNACKNDTCLSPRRPQQDMGLSMCGCGLSSRAATTRREMSSPRYQMMAQVSEPMPMPIPEFYSGAGDPGGKAHKCGCQRRRKHGERPKQESAGDGFDERKVRSEKTHHHHHHSHRHESRHHGRSHRHEHGEEPEKRSRHRSRSRKSEKKPCECRGGGGGGWFSSLFGWGARAEKKPDEECKKKRDEECKNMKCKCRCKRMKHAAQSARGREPGSEPIDAAGEEPNDNAPDNAQLERKASRKSGQSVDEPRAPPNSVDGEDPPTKAPTKAPSKAAAKTPAKAPAKEPAAKPKTPATTRGAKAKASPSPAPKPKRK